ncbi:MAG: DUF4349 domain-containing protein [Syntrophomonadaceae bacterium]|nr:DUF4349 domain-containing protein [Syntrophomonadaceae bacterium]
MKCRHVRTLLSPYIDGVLPEDKIIELEKHLSSCDDCRRELGDLEMLIAKLKDMETLQVPNGFMEEMHERLLQEKAAALNDKNKFMKTIPKWFVATAASVALLAGIYISSMIPSGIMANLFDNNEEGNAPQSGKLSWKIEKFLQEKEAQMQAALQDIQQGRETVPDNDRPSNTQAPPVVTDPDPVPDGEAVTDVPMMASSGDTKMISTVSLQMKSADIDETVNNITELAALYNGDVESSNSQLMAGVSQAMVIRVSPEKLGSFVSGVQSLGFEAQPMVGALDVSEDYSRLQDRLAEVETIIADFEDLEEMDVDETDKYQAMKFERAYLEKQLETLEYRTDLVAVNVTITAEEDQ